MHAVGRRGSDPGAWRREFPSPGFWGPRLSSSRNFSFVQISDSHIGFNKPANQDVAATPASGDREDQRPGEAAGLRDPHRRPDSPGEGTPSSTRSVNFSRLFASARYSMVPGRTRRNRRRRKALSAEVRPGQRAAWGGRASDHKGVHFAGPEQRRPTRRVGEDRPGSSWSG